MTDPRPPKIVVSIVSHRQASLVQTLLGDLAQHAPDVAICLTANLPEPPPTALLPFTLLTNPHPKGFGENHNAAFQHCDADFFCVLNPDIRLTTNPFPALLDCLSDPQVGLVVPQVTTVQGIPEDNARHFPTLAGLVKKVFGLSDGRIHAPENSPISIDWAAGMFLMFRADAFRAIRGFDENFFLYYEDVDICVRLWAQHWQVRLCPQTSVIHNAQRDSRRKLRYTLWHLSSMARYFFKHGLLKAPTR
ncbi:MAG: glycosyltransferase [Ferrovum myxofaciens]|uniref:glycosyltransferase family 2 protein n=1 Tax=Ferrovum myxofaciens TaxID=416213 RepID=UPI0023554E23|nr:glycosyltransferase family 2 protein [Ferrovum myxofaciens]QKE40702.1 MAG: glycosyltransferase [Ferrovum myxofaciens]